MRTFSVNLLFFCTAILCGIMISLLGPIALLAVPIAGYFSRMIMSRKLHIWIAVGLTIGVLPLWSFVVFITSDYTTSIVWCLQIILVPVLWIGSGWAHVRWHQRFKSFIAF